MPKLVETIVSTQLKDLRVPITQNTTGRELFYRIVGHIGLKEIWYFGLEYTDTKDTKGWLKLNRKVLHHDLQWHGSILRFNFGVKFFPEDLTNELIQLVTQKLFYLQAKGDILSDNIYCPVDKAVLLASLWCQAEFGKYDELPTSQRFLLNEKLLPDRIIDQYTYPKEEWAQRITQLWKRHGDMSNEDAIVCYLKIVQDLEMFGVNYFQIANKKGSDLWLGIDCFGLHVYQSDNKLTPQVGFPWSEIKTLSFKDHRFLIKPIDKKSPDFVFTASSVTKNKRILALSMGNHELYMRRRRPVPVEIEQMKNEEEVAKKTKREERTALLREREKRIIAEQKNEQLLEKTKGLEETVQGAELALRTAQNNNLELEQQRTKLEEVSREIEVKMSRELSMRAHEDEYLRNKNALANELEQMLEKRKAKEQQKQLEQAQRRVEEERRKHKEEMEKNSIELKQAQELLEEERRKRSQVTQSRSSNYVPESLQIFDQGQQRSSPSQGRFRLPEPDEVDGVSSAHQDLSVMQNAPLPTFDEQAGLGNYLQNTLESINLALDTKDKRLTIMDHIYAANVSAGVNKYKTLKRIRMGNTKQKVDQFELM